MNHRDNGNNAQPNSPGGGIIKEKSLNDRGKDKKPKSQKTKLKKPKNKPENQKPKAEAKPLPQGFTALESCRITELNKLTQYTKMTKALAQYARGTGFADCECHRNHGATDASFFCTQCL